MKNRFIGKTSDLIFIKRVGDAYGTAAFEEHEHPRDPKGKFKKKDGELIEPTGIAAQVSEELKKGQISHDVISENKGETQSIVIYGSKKEQTVAQKLGGLYGADIGKHIDGHAKVSFHEGEGTDKYEPPEDDEPAGSSGVSRSLDMQDLKKIAPKKGSNEGGVYEHKDSKEQFYIKTPKTKDHVQNELLAAKLYELAKSPTMEYVPVKGGEHVATKLEPLTKDNISKFNELEKSKARDEFGVHAWLANWDAAGTGGDNQVIVGSQVRTVDVGGSLKYRAQGTPKGDDFGDKVKETATLLDPIKNPDSHKLYGPMTVAEKLASYKRVTDISDFDITKTVHDAGAPYEMAEKLIARRNDLAAQAKAIAHLAPEITPIPTYSSPLTEALAKNIPTNPPPPPPIPVLHPAAEFKNKVIGNSAERVAMRKQLQTATGDEKKLLQKKIIASFWKQHDKLSGDKQTDIAKKTAEYAKKYGMANPLVKSWAPPPTSIPITTSPPVPSIAELQKTVSFDPPPLPPTTITPAELEKAKKNLPLKAQYVPGAVPGDPAMEALITKFNEKYEGKVLTSTEDLEAKVKDFNKLKADMIPLMTAAQQQAAATAAHQKLIAEQQAAKAKAEQIAKTKIPEDHELDNMTEDEIAVHMLNVATKGAAASYMKNNPYGAKHGLTPTDVGFIRAYCGSFYSKENSQLRDGVMSERVYHYKEFLTHALDQLPAYPEKIIYRKITVDDAFMAKTYNNPENKVVQWGGFSSCAKTDKKWHGNWMFKVHHKYGRDVEPISQHGSSEAEVLLSPTMVKVLSFDPVKRIVEVEELVSFKKKFGKK